MSNDSILSPWYGIERDAARQSLISRPRSAVELKKETPASNAESDALSASMNYRSADLVLMELTVKGRRDLHGIEPFAWPDDFYHDVCSAWFATQKSKGLEDMVFLCGSHAAKVALKPLACCIFCWYKNGSTNCFVPSTKSRNGNANYPDIAPLKVYNKLYKGETFEDNKDSFIQALQDIVDYAPFDGWKSIFRTGLITMRLEHVVYNGAENTFPMPEPYYKYLLAATQTNPGGGMGSWYDLPISGSGEFAKVTDALQEERNKAILFAVNNC